MYPGEFEHFLGPPSRRVVQQTQRRRFWGTQLVGLMSDFTDGQALCVDFGRQPRACFRGRQGPATARRDVSSPPLGTEWEAGSTAGEPGRRFLTSHPLVFPDLGRRGKHVEGGSRDARGDLSAETQRGLRPVCCAALTTGQETRARIPAAAQGPAEARNPAGPARGQPIAQCPRGAR